MATIIPELPDARLTKLPSQAEAKVYKALRDQLPKGFVIFFQVGWILRREEEAAKDGETDFIVCHPELGYLCIEVKGGGIEFVASSDEWFSVDRNHQRHVIKDPVKQALNAKYSIRLKLTDCQDWKNLRLRNILMGHCVFFPEVYDTNALTSPDLPATLIGGLNDLQGIRAWIDGVFSFWRNDTSRFTPLGKPGVNVLREVFAKSFKVLPLVSSQLADQEARRLVLTEDQIRVLDNLRSHRRVAVSGGAGTGKTLLALEKARRLASEGFRTLLTCYNRPLADYLSSLCSDSPNLEVMGFHQLCHRQVEKANQASGRDLINEAKRTYPGKDYFDVQLPNALSYSLEVLLERHDAIVCDEGQDFREDYWVPLEFLLSDFDKGPLYIFYDDNQNLYTRATSFPIEDEPFSLTTNCRNTAPIHTTSYKYYKGVPVSAPDIQGDEVQFDESPGQDPQASKINARIVDLIAKQKVAPEDITVLIADSLNKAEYYSRLKKLPLPRPAKWLKEGVRGKNTVLIETIQRFKGLESPIVILWGLDTIDLSQRQELLYVGMSRAKSLLIIVGRKDTLAAIKGI